MTLTLQLPDEKQAALSAKAQALGVSTEEYACQVLVHDIEAEPRPCRHISDIIRENMSRVPAEIMAKMPADGASQHDHYIYGLPKKKQ
jgi:hypothetical protein